MLIYYHASLHNCYSTVFQFKYNWIFIESDIINSIITERFVPTNGASSTAKMKRSKANFAPIMPFTRESSDPSTDPFSDAGALLYRIHAKSANWSSESDIKTF